MHIKRSKVHIVRSVISRKKKNLVAGSETVAGAVTGAALLP